MTTEPTVVQRIEIDIKTVELRLHGTSPLIVHKWSEKAKKEMLDKQMGRASKGKEKKDPERDYRDSMYLDEAGDYAFPAVAFKAAAVRAGTYCDMPMTFLRGALHIEGEFVRIVGEPRPREDMVRLGGKMADIRYRAEFPQWEAVVRVTYNVRAITAEQLVNLFNLAGFAVGVGEWRPEKNGQYGRFEVV